MDKIIENIYYDPAGHGSMRTTYEDAKKKDKSITYVDIQAWFKRNIERKTQLKGYNSFIASEPKQEYQCDLFFMNYLNDPEFSKGLLMVDIFTKFVSIIPINSRTANTLLDAMKESMLKMGGTPQTLYTDDEGGLRDQLIQNYLKDQNIRHIVTRSHAAVAERTIRTIKAMIEKRIESAKKRHEDKRWVDVLNQVLITYNFKNKHSATKMTPKEATLPANQLQVKTNLEMKRKHTRIYPDINVGDYVKIYNKKSKYAKERIPVWSKENFKVESINESIGQNFYKVEGRDRPLMRFEILLVN